MTQNFSCCFCNKTSGDVHDMLVNPFGYRIQFLQENQPCEKCNSLVGTPTAMHSDFKELQFFVPAIDKILLPRFLRMLVDLEQYSFAFSSQVALELLKPVPLVVAKDTIIDGENRFIPYFKSSNILVTKSFGVRDISPSSNITKYLYQKLFDAISCKQLTIRAKFIELYNIKITADIFFQLLSPQLVDLTCVIFELTTLLNPIDFIEKLPNVEKFLFTDKDYTSYWDTELVEPINCKALKKFCIAFKCIDVTLKSFTDITKKWSKSQINIFQNINGIDNEPLVNLPHDAHIQSLYHRLMKDK